MQKLTEKNLNAPFIVFAGDSRLRQLRDGLVLELTGQETDILANPGATVDQAFYRKHEAHGNFYESAGAHIRFEWTPYLDKRDSLPTTLSMIEFVNRTLQSAFKPSFLVLGVGVWRIRDCHRERKLTQEQCAQEYKQ